MDEVLSAKFPRGVEIIGKICTQMHGDIQYCRLVIYTHSCEGIHGKPYDMQSQGVDFVVGQGLAPAALLRFLGRLGITEISLLAVGEGGPLAVDEVLFV